MDRFMTTRILRALERSKARYGIGCAEAKLALLRRIGRDELGSARAVSRLHEVLCFLRAYPDDARVLAQVERMLVRFAGRADLKRAAGGPARWNADPEDVQKSVVRLVLALVEFLRKLMERQAIRRMEAGTLEPHQIEDMGLALMRLEETVVDMAARFGLTPEELNLDLGPLGKLM